jgi:hypothetical protein
MDLVDAYKILLENKKDLLKSLMSFSMSARSVL